MNILAAYALFYNPLNLVRALVSLDSLWWYRLFWQLLGNASLVRTAIRQLGWLRRLRRGPIERLAEAPRPRFPLAVPDRVDVRLVHDGTARSRVRPVTAGLSDGGE